jgi:serine carboxypeptidase-like clade 2
LANAIIDYNAKAARRINLAGLLIGNGCTHPSECTNAYGAYPPHVFDYYGRHNLISESTYQLTKDNQEKCVGNFSDECLAISDKVNTEFSADLFINPYNVYGKCPIYSGRNGKSQAPLTYMLNPSLRDGGVPPCADVLGMFTYLRNPDFRRALHIPEILPTWDICSNIDYQVDDKASYYLYPKLIASGIRIWKFSGDVPITPI